ncbi:MULTISPECIES: hypothetical protein [unclassified Crossiella]|uniref:hypothetical protein n=1 Tax=unclassified Crossiella TaxID=2620835 RepID=UPI001FFFB2A5|nr:MULTISPECIES: hypothetical protein [unclassified Crossiella]MCK2242335.1 hypothetical protein [Crossiella sp. S99.2]MCK2254634.1 hypothetical protein [Crossiella sp. S99.1]
MSGQQYAQFRIARWSDPRWRALGRDAQWLYTQLVSHPDRSLAGVVPLLRRKFAAGAHGTTPAEVSAALAELATAEFVTVDEDTEEVLVRGFIADDGLWKQPRMLAVALRKALLIHSAGIRADLAADLRRLPADRVGHQVEPVVSALLGGPDPTPDVAQAQGVASGNGVGGYVKGVEGAPAPSTQHPHQQPHAGTPAHEAAAPGPEHSAPTSGPANVSVRLVLSAVPRQPEDVQRELINQTAGLLAEGIPAETVTAGLRRWSARPLGPRALPSLVAEVMRQVPERSVQASRTDEWAAVAAELAAESDDPPGPAPAADGAEVDREFTALVSSWQGPR